jgi:uncharacterized membrane protein
MSADERARPPAQNGRVSDWLRDRPTRSRRHPDVTWIPFVTFWKLTTVIAVGQDSAPCVGRRYGAELVPAWGAVLGEVPSQDYLRIVAGVEQMGVPRRVTGGWLRGDGQPS